MLLNTLYRCGSERPPDCPVLAELGLEPRCLSPKSRFPLALAGVPGGTGHARLGIRRSCPLARLAPEWIMCPVEFHAKGKCCRHPDRRQRKGSQASSLQGTSPLCTRAMVPATICWSRGSSGHCGTRSHKGERPPGKGLRSPGRGWPCRWVRRQARLSGYRREIHPEFSKGIPRLHPKGCSLSLNMGQGSFSAKTRAVRSSKGALSP